MLKYQIKKLSKEGDYSRSVLLEDILTSDVFGIMEYFDYELLLKPLLMQIKAKNPAASFIVPEIGPMKIRFWESYDWDDRLPSLDRVCIEPDVVFEWPELLIFIESKFMSGLDPDELLREYLIGSLEANGERSFVLLLINRALMPPAIHVRQVNTPTSIGKYIELRLSDLDMLNEHMWKHPLTNISWINWQSIYAIANAAVSNRVLSAIEKNILSDLLLVMDRKGLAPYDGLDIKEFMDYSINPELLNQLGSMIDPSVVDFADINIDVESINQLLIGCALNRQSLDYSDCTIDLNCLDNILPRALNLHTSKRR